ncbi:MAG TPA: cation diffusion facilitator family transporter [Candidatus Fimivivens sp.]|nr:cation diffusion facilitator family transporter [Candidatus Fimivivens sp.]
MHEKNVRGFLPVLAALGGNTVIAILKWMGFFVSGSGAMFSEAVHSVADVFNQVFLMIGIRRSLKPSDGEYPYGYAGERFFWAVLSACSIFFLGSGVTVYHGFDALVHGEAVHVNPITILILLVSLVVESGTFFVAFRELVSHGNGRDFSEILKRGDPTTIAVLYEDGLAVLGVIIALGSILLTLFTGKYYWDAIGSIVIGVLLGVMALLLINKNRSFLIRRSVPEEVAEHVVSILEGDPFIERVLDFKSVVIDVGIYHVKCEVEVNGSALMRGMYRGKVLRSEFEEIDSSYEEFVRFCSDYADRIPRMIGTRVDEVEQKIKEEIPQVRHIDIEVN